MHLPLRSSGALQQVFYTASQIARNSDNALHRRGRDWCKHDDCTTRCFA